MNSWDDEERLVHQLMETDDVDQLIAKVEAHYSSSIQKAVKLAAATTPAAPHTTSTMKSAASRPPTKQQTNRINSISSSHLLMSAAEGDRSSQRRGGGGSGVSGGAQPQARSTIPRLRTSSGLVSSRSPSTLSARTGDVTADHTVVQAEPLRHDDDAAESSASWRRQSPILSDRTNLNPHLVEAGQHNNSNNTNNDDDGGLSPIPVKPYVYRKASSSPQSGGDALFGQEKKDGKAEEEKQSSAVTAGGGGGKLLGGRSSVARGGIYYTAGAAAAAAPLPPPPPSKWLPTASSGSNIGGRQYAPPPPTRTTTPSYPGQAGASDAETRSSHELLFSPDAMNHRPIYDDDDEEEKENYRNNNNNNNTKYDYTGKAMRAPAIGSPRMTAPLFEEGEEEGDKLKTNKLFPPSSFPPAGRGALDDGYGYGGGAGSSSSNKEGNAKSAIGNNSKSGRWGMERYANLNKVDNTDENHNHNNRYGMVGGPSSAPPRFPPPRMFNDNNEDDNNSDDNGIDDEALRLSRELHRLRHPPPPPPMRTAASSASSQNGMSPFYDDDNEDDRVGNGGFASAFTTSRRRAPPPPLSPLSYEQQQQQRRRSSYYGDDDDDEAFYPRKEKNIEAGGDGGVWSNSFTGSSSRRGGGGDGGREAYFYPSAVTATRSSRGYTSHHRHRDREGSAYHYRSSSDNSAGRGRQQGRRGDHYDEAGSRGSRSPRHRRNLAGEEKDRNSTNAAPRAQLGRQAGHTVLGDNDFDDLLSITATTEAADVTTELDDDDEEAASRTRSSNAAQVIGGEAINNASNNNQSLTSSQQDLSGIKNVHPRTASEALRHRILQTHSSRNEDSWGGEAPRIIEREQHRRPQQTLVAGTTAMTSPTTTMDSPPQQQQQEQQEGGGGEGGSKKTDGTPPLGEAEEKANGADTANNNNHSQTESGGPVGGLDGGERNRRDSLRQRSLTPEKQILRSPRNHNKRRGHQQQQPPRRAAGRHRDPYWDRFDGSFVDAPEDDDDDYEYEYEYEYEDEDYLEFSVEENAYSMPYDPLKTEAPDTATMRGERETGRSKYHQHRQQQQQQRRRAGGGGGGRAANVDDDFEYEEEMYDEPYYSGQRRGGGVSNEPRPRRRSDNIVFGEEKNVSGGRGGGRLPPQSRRPSPQSSPSKDTADATRLSVTNASSQFKQAFLNNNNSSGGNNNNNNSNNNNNMSQASGHPLRPPGGAVKPNQKNLVSPGDKKRNPNALRRSSQLLYTKRVPPPPPQASASKSAAVVTGQGESLTAPVGDGAGAGGGGSLDANGQQQHQQSHQNNINTNSNGGISHDSGQQRPNQKNTTGEGASKKAEKGKGGTGVGPGLPPQRPPRQRGKLAAAGRGGGGRTSSARYGMGNMSMLSGRSGSVAPVGLSRPGLLYGSLLPTASAKTTMLSTTAADSLMRRQQMRRSFTFPPKSGRRGAGGASSPPPRADGGQWIVPVGGTKGGFLGEEDLFLPPKPEGEGARMRRLLQQVKKPAGESSTSAPQTVAWVSGSFGSVPPKRIRRAASAHAALTGGAAGSAEDKEKDNSPSKKTAKELKVIATTVPRVLYSGFASIPTRHGPIPPPEEEEAHTMSRRLSEDLRSLWSAQPKPAASALSNLQEDAPHSSRLVLHAQEAEEKDTATTGGVPSLPATVAATAGGGGSHPTIPASLSVGSVHSNSHYVSAMPLKNTSNLNVAAATPAARGSAGGAERKKSTSLTGMIQVPSAASISTPALQASNSASAAGIAVGEAQRFGITSLTR